MALVNNRQACVRDQNAFVMATLISFMAIISVLGYVVLLIGIQAQQIAARQQLIQQAQLASTSALEYAKEQYESDITYAGSPEQVLSNDGRYEVRFEVVHQGFTNGVGTQQDVVAIGRVYDDGGSSPLVTRQIRGKLTRDAGSGRAARFIFIIDNSGSMSETDWLESKGTVDAAIEYVLDNTTAAEVAVVQYGTNTYSFEHKYDVTVPFTSDKVSATNWDRHYGPGSTSYYDLQDHLAASLARMRIESVYGPGDQLDLVGATNVQYVLFTDAFGTDTSGCCSALKKVSGEPNSWYTSNGSGFSVLDQHGEFNALKDGSVFTADGYSGLSAQFTVLNINTTTSRETLETSAAIASPGGTWTGVVDANPDDPEGEGLKPRRYISTSLSAGPTEIISVLEEIIEDELNF